MPVEKEECGGSGSKRMATGCMEWREQGRLMATAWPIGAALGEVPDAGHLLPEEQPALLAKQLRRFWA